MKRKKRINYVIFIVILIVITLIILGLIIKNDYSTNYPVHKDITVTYFWVGEGATEDNNYISNSVSAWDENWMDDFGGVDDPENRASYLPESFIPHENSFYFALPYNDLDENGNKKENSDKIYWATEKDPKEKSILKNRWIRIIKGSKTAYAQWEDVGPFEDDDINYVFGSETPQNNINQNAGLDVSPAVRDYLGLSGMDKADWQFVDYSSVPEGPWKERITSG